VPFYYILPPLRLSELPASIPVAYLKATAAIALLSWLAMVLAGFAIFQVATRQCGLGKRDGLLAAALLFLLCWHMLRLVHLPGNDYQVQPHDYTPTIFANLAASISGRGLLLDVLPSLLVAGVAIAGWPVMQAGLPGRLFRRTDALVIPALILVALAVTKSFDIGRVVMHAAPLYVVPAVGSLSHWSRWYQGFARPRDVLAPSCRAKVGFKP
jgi:hypothetical protein